MRIHHVNCGTYRPYGGHLWDGQTAGLGEARLVCHCLIIEDSAGLVLVDTGLGTLDCRDPGRIPTFFKKSLRMALDPDETMLAHVRRLGFGPRDVRHIVLTHLDFDHAGGLTDFPEANVHVFALEAASATLRRGLLSSKRYVPAQWGDRARWHTYGAQGERWFDFEAVRQLAGVSEDILLIPLVGHTRGHCGVAIRRGSDWLLHAGDAYFCRGEMSHERRWCTTGLRGYQLLMEQDHRARRENQERLRLLARDRGDVRVFCAHDPVELATMTTAAVTPPKIASVRPRKQPPQPSP